jgi:predicted AAA+ superfamily ATPase
MEREKYYKRIIKPTKNNSFFLFGPRGVGKTSWLKKNYPKALYFDLLESGTFRKLITYPERLEEAIPKGFSDWIILDEIQKIPELLNEVHRLIENEKYKFILTGSSARQLRKKGVNLLAGRAYTYFMHPLTVEELGSDFSLQKSLKVGHLPRAYLTNNTKRFLNAYLETYLKEEVKEEGLTRNLGDFYRFLDVAVFSQGEVLNLTEVARECLLKRDKVEGYFNILEDLLLAVQIPVFNRRSKRKLISKNKFYYFDVGVFRHLRQSGLLDTESEIDGPALETLFLQEMRAVNDYYEMDYRIHYWRTKTGLEVDFVLYGEKGLLAIEIKRKKNITDKDLRGLKAFGKEYSEARKIVFCGVKKAERRGDIEILPVEYGLKNLKKILRNK